MDNTAVLVKYTYYGDADFSGLVTFDDYARIDAGFSGSHTGWLNGDFDGSGSCELRRLLVDRSRVQHAGAVRSDQFAQPRTLSPRLTNTSDALNGAIYNRASESHDAPRSSHVCLARPFTDFRDNLRSIDTALIRRHWHFLRQWRRTFFRSVHCADVGGLPAISSWKEEITMTHRTNRSNRSRLQSPKQILASAIEPLERRRLLCTSHYDFSNYARDFPAEAQDARRIRGGEPGR